MRKIGVSMAVAASVAGSGVAASAATTTKATEHVQLTLVRKSGSKFQHKGKATGTVAGSVTSRIALDSLSIDGTVTIAARGGTLNLKIRGTARSGGLRAKFDGMATMAGGTGRYAKASGKGKFTGIVNRSTWAAAIDANGSLSY